MNTYLQERQLVTKAGTVATEEAQKKTQGLHPGELLVIGGPTSVKSDLENLANHDSELTQEVVEEVVNAGLTTSE